MSFIGEAIATAAIDVLFKKLASTELLQFAHRENIHADLKMWEKNLKYIKAVLDDAEEKQLENRSVKIWLGELNNLAYDVEDILDEFATEALRRKLEDQSSASTSKVQKIIPSCFTGLSPRSIKFGKQMASKIKEITTRLEEITAQRDNFNLIENSGGRRPYRVEYRRWPETSVSEPHIYGRDADKEAILELLLKDESTDGNFSVISIVGMGGMGKTTLAQLAYNDVKVDAFFDVKIWACVSDNFDIIGITKTILQSRDIDNLDELQVALKKKLSGKKFLIVLDDVWNEKYGDWTLLCRPFQSGSFGSKILVTTRNQSVSSVVGSLQPYQLKKLSNDDCLSVFTQHSLGKTDFGEHQDLEEIGTKIMERCDGLPLAAKTLGGLLCGKCSRKDWEDVLNDKIWNLQAARSDILPALTVSYHYLPPHLKRCFAYCSIFPKDYELCKQDIILLWMAVGFLETDRSEKQKEDLGNEYFEDLHSRSFFQQSSSNASSFVMHDLIHDLAEWAAGDFCSRVENMSEDEKQWKISESIRHLSHLNDGRDYYRINKFEAFNNEMKSLRTFFTLSWDSFHFHDTNLDFPCMLLQLRRLRVLSLKRYPISKLPNSIGDMKLLHHLDLSYTKIKFLPDSVNKLYNLEALILNGCYELERLCSDMGNLIKLRHLNVPNSFRLEAMPLRIGKLTSLRTLHRFVVSKDIRSGLKELKDLKHLQEGLHISGLENVNDFVDAENANLNGKDGLKDIQLEWTSRSDVLNEKEIATQVLEKLRPCQKLESLHINGYGGTQLPRWLGDTSLSSLVSLTFEDCKNYASFPSIGKLPSLKKLVIRNVDGIESLGPEFYGHNYYSMAPFQSLEEFTIESLQDLKVWFPCGSGRNVEAFPRLQKLSIRECSKLEGKLPEHLPSLKSLLIEDCEQWMVSIPRLPEDCTIQIVNCKEVVLSSLIDCSSLSSMVHLLSGISSRIFLTEGFAEGFSKVEKLDIVAYDEPTSFLKSGNHSLQEFKKSMWKLSIEIGHVQHGSVEGRLQQNELPGRCQYLILEGCQCPEKLEQAFQSLSFLRGITIRESKEIKFFPEACLPSQLRFIDINGCDALQSLPMAWMHSSNTSLEELSISHCRSLKCIARVQLPSNLKRLEIMRCINLLTVLDDEEVSGSCKNTSCLEKLIITDCPSLTSLWSSSGNRHTSLEELSINDCDSLTCIAGVQLPSNLKRLKIMCCSNLLTVLDEEEVSGSCKNTSCLEKLKIEELDIHFCKKLETLPSGINNLISLKKLRISDCPAMVSIPEGGFPTSLTSLVIREIEICELTVCKSLFEWGLHRLTSLEELNITGGCPDVMSFPQEEIGMILPVSLKSLHISDFPNLERLSSIAQNLTCLEKLTLLYCPKLKYFPDDGLPQSLKQYRIIGCPLLEERCKEGEGLYWSMIAHLSGYDTYEPQD